MGCGAGDVLHLRSSGVSVVFDLEPAVPRVLHWGHDLGDLTDEGLEALRMSDLAAWLHSSPDAPRGFSIWPTEYEGWSGTPAQTGHLNGTATTPRVGLIGTELSSAPDGSSTVTFRLRDDVSQTDVHIAFTLTFDGLLEFQSTLAYAPSASAPAGDRYDLQSLFGMMPLPGSASEIVDFTGKWCRERSPQRVPLPYGTHARTSRRGKPGHDSPFLLMAGTAGFSFRRGEVWGIHVAWSGDQDWFVERLPEGAGAFATVLGGGEYLRPGEVRLAAGESYRSPKIVFGWSDAGMDGLSARFHRSLRRRPGHPRTIRPLVLNTWEAVYFDHRLERLLKLTDLAHEIGVERVVLDDGWFAARRDDSAGLGDWVVDRSVWPDGLTPLVERVRDYGMQFGLWFEPEMINLRSDLARTHPDWLLAPSTGLGPPSRNQYVLDITHPDAWQYLLESINTLVNDYSIDFLKWDHNRDLHEAVSRSPAGDRPAVHAQTTALYGLIDTLRERNPGLEIETCSAGGARVDLGILQRTDRIWATDCNDPIERQQIQRWTSLLVPPELVGSHVGAPRSHTTGRITDTSFRLATSLFAHAGIEWDLTQCTGDELDTLKAWSALYREFRHLIHSGTVVNADLDDDATMLRGVFAPDRSRALLTWARFTTSAAGQSGRVRFPGVDANLDYRLRVRCDIGIEPRHEVEDPAWFSRALASWVRIPGAILAYAGLPMPTLNPAQAILLELESCG